VVFRNLLDGGPSRNRPLLGPFESMWGGTLDTNPRQQPPSAWQVSRYWVIWIFLVYDSTLLAPICASTLISVS
jgi:hypothetical protein